MAGQQLTGSMGRVMDQLVVGARAKRDSAMNTLDAVDRQTKAASEEIARTVVTVRPPTPEDFGDVAGRRDDRFDPEEWTVPQNSGTAAADPGAPRGPVANGRARRNDDDEEDYPETWLR